MAAAALARVPMDITYVYETTDRNFPLVAEAVINSVVRQQEDALRKAKARSNG